MATIFRRNGDHEIRIQLSTGEVMTTNEVWLFHERLPGVIYRRHTSPVQDQFGPAVRIEHEWEVDDQVVVTALQDYFTDQEILNSFPSLEGKLPARDEKAIAEVNLGLVAGHRCINVRYGKAVIKHSNGYYTKYLTAS